MHCGEAQGDTIVCVHRAALLCCTILWTSSASQDRPKVELGSTYGIGLYSILSPEWKLIRPADKVRY
jgi:hypothetical protein